MTNKTERYYIVSGDELDELKLSGYRLGLNHGRLSAWDELDQAEAACRARPVYHSNSGPAFVPVEGYWFEVKK